jgi:hypothetical protein
MTILQLIINVILLCIPVIGLIAIGRACLCIFRCLMSKRKEIAVIPLFSIVLMLCFIGMGILVLLGYGVAHSGKNALNDFVVLAIVAAPNYLCAFGLWRVSKFLEGKLDHERAKEG